MSGVLRHLVTGIAEALVFLAVAYLFLNFGVAFTSLSSLPILVSLILVFGNVLPDLTIFPLILAVNKFNVQKALRSQLWAKLKFIDEYVAIFLGVVFFIVVKITNLMCLAYPVALGLGVVSHLVIDFLIKEKGKNGFLW